MAWCSSSALRTGYAVWWEAFPSGLLIGDRLLRHNQSECTVAPSIEFGSPIDRRSDVIRLSREAPFTWARCTIPGCRGGSEGRTWRHETARAS